MSILKNGIIRKATLDDLDFVVDTIIESEKSGTERCGFANFFGLTEDEARMYLKEMLEEEIDGCEFSIDSFLVVEIDGKVVAASGSWVEGHNSSDLPSSILKANLIGYVLPKEKIAYASSHSSLIDDIQIERTTGALQLEYSYCKKEFRGRGYSLALDLEHMDNSDVKLVETQMYSNNNLSKVLYENMGFEIDSEFISNNEETIKFFPYDRKILMTCHL